MCLNPAFASAVLFDDLDGERDCEETDHDHGGNADSEIILFGTNESD